MSFKRSHIKTWITLHSLARCFLFVSIFMTCTQLHAQGFDNTALGGGGVALENSNLGIWQNPAQIFQKVTPVTEMGIFDLASKQALFGTAVIPVGQYTTIGGSSQMGPYFDAFHKVHQAVLALEPFPFAYIGGKMRVEDFNNNTQNSYSVGTRALLNPDLYLGAYVDGIGQPNDSNLNYQIGLAWTPQILENPKDAFLFADIRTPNLNLTHSQVILGAGIQKGPVQNFKAEMALQWKQEDKGQIYGNGGIRLQEQFLGVFVQLFYSISQIGIYHAKQEELLHTAGLGIQLFPYRDVEEPIISIRTNKHLLQFNSAETEKNSLLFFVRAEDNSKKFKDWHLVIASVNSELKPGALVKSYSGQGIPPKTVEWDGTESSSLKVGPGLYFYRLIVRDEAQNMAQTQWQMIEVR
jgi:hypothetical protein